MKHGNVKTLRFLQRAFSVIMASGLATLPIACGGGGVSIAPSTPQASPAFGIVALPSASSFATASTSSPAASSVATAVTLPFASAAGYGGSATLEVASVPPGLHLGVRFTSSAPPLATPFATVRKAAPTAVRVANAAVSTPSNATADANDRVIAYVTIATSEALAISTPPQYSFALPAGFAVPGVAYYLALWNGTTWLPGYSVGTLPVAGSGATTVHVKGLYGLSVPASGAMSIALYARNTSAATPAPAPLPTATAAASATPVPTATPQATATPVPTATPQATATPVPTATPQPTATPVSTPMPTPTPHVTTTPTPAPTPTPTPTATPLVMTVSSTSLSFTSTAVQHLTVTETGYTGAFTETNTCSGIATVTPASANGPSAVFSVTPVNGGLCSIHFAGSSGLTAAVSVGVTTIIIPVQ